MNERLRSRGLYIILPAIELDLRGVERAFQWQFSKMMNKTIRSTQFERRQDAKIRTLLAPQPLCKKWTLSIKERFNFKNP